MNNKIRSQRKMASPLEKARLDRDSMKARILNSARKLFGEYGYHGTTTRMIATHVGIDISTLYYHWGEKRDLYDSVITDINDEVQDKLLEIENLISGKPIAERIEIGIDNICDYLFDNPEISNLILFRYFSKTRDHDYSIETKMPEYISNIALSLGLASKKSDITVEAKARVLAVWNAVLNFISGINVFQPILDIEKEKYIQLVKETLNFILIPAFSKN
jgi:AcrR family transcriptional regulator